METKNKYELEREQEKQQNKAIRDRLGVIAESMGYTVVVSDNDIFFDAHIKATKGDECLYFHANGYKLKGRVSVGGSYPRDNNDQYMYPEHPPKAITISLNKSNEQIIKDIENRFLPSYLAELETIKERINKSNQQRANRNNIIEKIALVMGLEFKQNDQPTISKWEYSEQIKRFEIESDYNGEEITFNVRVSKDVALEFANFLKGLTKEHTANNQDPEEIKKLTEQVVNVRVR
jgi:hypothetical protein